MEKLHPGAKWIFRLNSYIVLIIFGIIFIPSLIVFLSGISRSEISGIIFQIVIAIAFFVVVLGEIFTRWYYNNWKYEFAKDQLKIEKGIIVKIYKSIPYGRIQNVDIKRGILARIIGFSTLDIQTAGYSYIGKRGVSEGHIPAVSKEKAEKIRDFLIKKISNKKSGL